jgi:hypothetical protein
VIAMNILGVKERLHLYLKSKSLSTDVTQLGFGQDGTVWQTSLENVTALKVFERADNFHRELACYLRLQEREVSDVAGFTVPQLIDQSEEFLAIEMTLVEPPCVLDFGKAYLDYAPDYWPDLLANLNEKLEEWHWQPARIKPVRSVIFTLLRYGIYYVDPRPGNIRFEMDDSA